MIGLLFVLVAGVVRSASISLSQAVEISMREAPFNAPFSNNLVSMNNQLFAQYGTGFWRASPSSADYSRMNHSSLVSQFMVESQYILKAIPEANSLLYVSKTGMAAVINVGTYGSETLTANKFLTTYGSFSFNYIFQAERKKGTNYFYLVSLIGATIHKINYANLNDTFRLLLSQDSGYEQVATSGSVLACITSLGTHITLFDVNLDALIGNYELLPNAGGSNWRSIEYYPRLPASRELYFLTRNDQRGYLFDLQTQKVMAVFPLSEANPEWTKWVPNTNYILSFGSTKIDFLDMEDSSNVKTHSLGSTEYYQGLFDFVEKDSKWHVAVNLYGYPMTKLFDSADHFCHYSCATCSKSMYVDACLTCKPGFEISGTVCNPRAIAPQVVLPGNILAGSCLAPTQFMTTDRYCAACQSNCDVCLDYTGTCGQCTTPYKLALNGTCVGACLPNEYQVDLGASGGVQCRTCNPLCTACTSASACTACPLLLTLTSGACVPSCNVAPNTQYIVATGACQACAASYCEQCTNYKLSYTCTKCQSGFYLFKGLCLLQCNSGLFVNQIDKKCELCEEMSPAKIFHEGACILPNDCPQGTVYQDLKCVGNSTNPAPPSPDLFSNQTGSLPGLSPVPAANDPAYKPSTPEEGSGITTWIVLGGLILVIIGLVVSFVLYGKNVNSRARERRRNGNVPPATNMIPLETINLPGATMPPNNPEVQPAEEKNELDHSELGEEGEPIRNEFPNLKNMSKINVFQNGQFQEVSVKPKRFRITNNL